MFHWTIGTRLERSLGRMIFEELRLLIVRAEVGEEEEENELIEKRDKLRVFYLITRCVIDEHVSSKQSERRNLE